MSLPETLTLAAEVVADILDDCGRPPDQIIRTLCRPWWDCCTDTGILSVWAEGPWVSGDRPGARVASFTCSPGTGLGTTIHVALLRCAPAGATPDETDVDAFSALLFADLSVVAARLNNATCAQGPRSLAAQLGVICHKAAFVDAAVICPQGGCAGVEWRIGVVLNLTADELCPPSS